MAPVVYMAPTPTKYSPKPGRNSRFIRRQQATNFAPAIRLAERNGHPLNTFVTINYTHTDCPAESVSAAFARLRDNYFTPWYRRPRKGQEAPKLPPAFVWVIENCNSQTGAHWLVHIPPARMADFKARIPRWLERTVGTVHCTASAIDIRPAINTFGLRKYMLKGIDPAYAGFYRINHVDQGVVHGKRLGFSASLGRTRCREARTYYTQIQRDKKAQRKQHGATRH